MVDKAFYKQETIALEDAKKRKQIEEEKKRVSQEAQKAKVADEKSKIEEIKDDEPPKEEKKSKVEVTPVSSSTPSKVEQVPEEEMTEEDKKNKDKLTPNAGNGSKTDKYSWTQTLGEVEVRITLPPGTKSKQITVDMKANHLKVDRFFFKTDFLWIA